MKLFLIFSCLAILTVINAQSNSCNGDACTYHGDCNGEEFCCEGACRSHFNGEEIAQEGEACLCDRCDTSQNLACENGVCVVSALLADALDCWCEEDSDCLIGFCQDFVCRSPPFEEGMSCHVDAHCIETLACEGNVCTANDPSEEAICYHADSNCGEGRQCFIDSEINRCVPNSIPIGENCLLTADLCEVGSFCDEDSFECVPLYEDGESCESNSECLSSSCEGVSLCYYKKDLDEVCNADSECISDVCTANGHVSVCTTLFGVGRFCSYDSVCQTGFCHNDRCSELLEAGEECDSDSECESGICYVGVCSAGEIGDTCSDSSHCTVGYCDIENMLCSELLDAGETCLTDSYCESERCESTGELICQPLLPAGAISFSASDCIYQRVESFTCAGLSFEYETCAIDEGCSGDMICHATSGVCRYPLPQYQSCTRDAECDDNVGICNSVLGYCNPPTTSSSCSRDEECIGESGYICNTATGYCRQPSTFIFSCLRDVECSNSSGYICSSYAGSCRQPQDSDNCYRDKDCLDQYCFNTICRTDTFNATCFSDNDCTSYMCDLDTNRCLDKLADGENCTDAINCFIEMCSDGVCGPPIVEVTVLLENGEICVIGDECTSDRCAPEKLCEELLDNGETCASDASCVSQFCNPLSGQCSDRLANGEECYSDYYCESYFCDTINNECSSQLTDGESCLDDYWCASLFCHPIDSVCFTPKLQDENCEEDFECKSSNCGENSKCREYYCGINQCRLGDTCRDDLDCNSGQCDGVCVPMPREVGEECSISNNCNFGLYCSAEEADKTCERIPVPSTCFSSFDCPAEYVCLGTNNKCVRKDTLPVDGPCDFDEQCRYYCNPVDRNCASSYESDFSECFDTNHCGPNSRCEQVGVCLSEDELADLDELCISKACRSGLYCSENRKCEIRSRNIPRGIELSEYQTESRHWCVTGIAWDGICVVVDEVEEGGFCFHDIECAGDARCVIEQCFGRNTLSEGDECVSSYSCDGRLICHPFWNNCTIDQGLVEIGSQCEVELDVEDDAMCLCEGNSREYVAIEPIDYIPFLKAFALDCNETDIEYNFEGYGLFTDVGLDITKSKGDNTNWDQCHASYVRLLCADLCNLPVVAEQFTDFQLYLELFQMNQDVLIDCETGLVTLSDTCPHLRLRNCDTINPVFGTVEDVLISRGLPAFDAERDNSSPKPVSSATTNFFATLWCLLTFLLH